MCSKVNWSVGIQVYCLIWIINLLMGASLLALKYLLFITKTVYSINSKMTRTDLFSSSSLTRQSRLRRLQYVAKYLDGTSIRTLKTKTQFLRPPFQLSANGVFRMKAGHFLRWPIRDIKTQLFILGNLNGKTYYF